MTHSLKDFDQVGCNVPGFFPSLWEGNYIFDSPNVSFGWCLRSAEGAAFSSRGRQAVDQSLENEVEARRAGTILRGEMRSSAAPSALGHFLSTSHGLTAVAI